MSSIVQTFQKRSQTLPVSSSLHQSHNPNHDRRDHDHRRDGQNQELQQQQAGNVIRRRLSSLYTERIEPISVSLRRTKSVSAMGSHAGASVKKWWEWGCAWILSRKPTFAQDLEMNEEETKALGSHCRGSWRHVFYKVRSELRRLIRSPDRVGLPQTCRYDSFNYAKNFDDGVRTRLIS